MGQGVGAEGLDGMDAASEQGAGLVHLGHLVDAAFGPAEEGAQAALGWQQAGVAEGPLGPEGLEGRQAALPQRAQAVGDQQLFGILGRGKTQVAYAKITLNVVNSITSEVVFSARGAGEYELSNREVLGFGGTAGYDATLNGKVLDLAMREAINNLVAGKDAGQWGN